MRESRGRRVERSLYATTQAFSRELGDIAWAAYRFGDDAQRELIDLAFDVAQFSVNDVFARTSDWTGQAQESAAVLGSGFDLAWQQGRNNFEVYSLVKNVRSRLNLDWSGAFDLAALVQAAYGLGAYADLWAIEGLGHDYAAMCLDEKHVQSGILRDGQAAALAASSLTMMHAGLGLALAERAVQSLTPYSSEAEFHDALTMFVAACDAHSRQGYTGAAYESLGLVVRTWHPQLVPRVDEALPRIDEGLVGYFWHGAGRALYFLPTYIVPGLLSPWRAADREAPHETAHNNLYAGLAWATALVNIRQPRIMAHLLRVRGEALARSPGFANGVASAVVMGIDTTPDDPYLLALAAYDAEEAEPRVRDLWNGLVRPAVIAGLERYHPLLRQHEHLELVFRYGDLEHVASCLERGEPVIPAGARPEPPHRAAALEPGGQHPGLYPSSSAPASQNDRGRR